MPKSWDVLDTMDTRSTLLMTAEPGRSQDSWLLSQLRVGESSLG